MIRRSEEHTRVLRQKLVSTAKLRGLKNSDIVVFLAEEGVVNPRTQQPYSVATINEDIKKIEKVWREEMLSDVSSHRARVLAEIGEVKAAAWKSGKFSVILRAIDQETNLLGLNELDRLAVEMNLANLLKGMPPELATQLRRMLTNKVAERKKMINVTPINSTGTNG